MTNLNYCQICGEWLGMDDYDGICTKCDIEEEEAPMATDHTATIRAALEFRRLALIGELPNWCEGHSARARYLAEMAAIDAALAHLDAPAVGQEWQPAPDGDYTYQVQRGQFYLVRVEDEGEILEAGFTEEFNEPNYIKLGQNLRLFQRVQPNTLEEPNGSQ